MELGVRRKATMPRETSSAVLRCPYSFLIGGDSWTEIIQVLPWSQPFRVEKGRKRQEWNQRQLKGFPTTSPVPGEMQIITAKGHYFTPSRTSTKSDHNVLTRMEKTSRHTLLMGRQEGSVFGKQIGSLKVSNMKLQNDSIPLPDTHFWCLATFQYLNVLT